MAATPWYRTAARNTALVGKHTAGLLDHLHRSTGADLQDFHLVGFSLGGHVVGLTGKHVQTGRVRKITGEWCWTFLNHIHIYFVQFLFDS